MSKLSAMEPLSNLSLWLLFWFYLRSAIGVLLIEIFPPHHKNQRSIRVSSSIMPLTLSIYNCMAHRPLVKIIEEEKVMPADFRFLTKEFVFENLRPLLDCVTETSSQKVVFSNIEFGNS